MIPEHCIEIFKKKYNQYPTIIGVNNEYIKADLTKVFSKSIEYWANERVDAFGKRSIIERFIDYDPLGIMVYKKQDHDIFILTTGDRKGVADYLISNLKKI